MGALQTLRPRRNEKVLAVLVETRPLRMSRSVPMTVARGGKKTTAQRQDR
jgi:hypothetical protein